MTCKEAKSRRTEGSKMSLREWQVEEQLKRLWFTYKDTGSQMTYRQILRKEREKKILDKVKKGV